MNNSHNIDNINNNIALVNGPNLNLLGKREPHLYGTTTLKEIITQVNHRAATYPTLNIKINDFQSNHEGALIDFIHSLLDDANLIGIILNPGAYSHTSIALHDALTVMTCPIVEVHLSNIATREAFRHHSYFSSRATGTITGLGAFSYMAALEYLIEQHRLKKKSS
ncbi:3-dehydroquinate dehydratase [Spirochaetota bacterium]|nr:3-dehydroquinate dehydratase [Spirochaetota bacterium]